MKRILLDTGPLVGLLSPADSHHKLAISAWKEVVPPLYTCWPVLTEAAWLLRTHPAAVERMLASATGGLFRLLPLDETDASGIAAIHKRHRKLRPQLADAALVHLAQRELIDTILTFDQRDFRVYRGPGGRPLKIIP